MARVALKNVTVDYGTTVALKNISFETEDGEFLVILGPAGAGKTTTLKVAAGLIKPTRGRVFMDGEDVTDKPGNLRNVAMTFEDYALYPTFSVRQNLENPFGAMENPPTKEEQEAKVMEVAKMLQIDHLLDRRVDQMSGGQKQRVSLARSMVRQPQIFLFDEPLSHVDAKIRHAMRAELHRLASVMATTTIYVTHDYVEALSLGDRIIVIDKGEIRQIGTPHEIYHKPSCEFVANVVGQPNINIYPFLVKQENGNLMVELKDTPECKFSPNGEAGSVLSRHVGEVVHIGFRPQDIRYSLSPINSHAFATKIELYELWGRRGMVMALLGEHEMRVLTDTDTRIDIGSQIWLDLSNAPLYLFDESGNQLA
jgi:multiple sugar transport system ATP-binding protein